MQFSYYVLWRWCSSFSKPFGSTSPKHFPFFFFFKIGEYPRVFYPQNDKKFLLSAWTTPTLLLRQTQGISARGSTPGCLWQSTNCHDKNRWLFIFLFVEHTVYLEISLSKVSWVTSRHYYIRPCAVLIE